MAETKKNWEAEDKPKADPTGKQKLAEPSEEEETGGPNVTPNRVGNERTNIENGFATQIAAQAMAGFKDLVAGLKDLSDENKEKLAEFEKRLMGVI